jgi:muramidase (phage lysozyme)
MPTAAQYRSYLQLPQVRAALDRIAWAEGGRSYNTLFGGGTFAGNQHPNRPITAGAYTSTEAGRYQFLYPTWIEIKGGLGLRDFSPVNQDIAALDQINQRGQLTKLINGDFEGMMKGLGCAWAALPYSTCGQKTKPLPQTMEYFRNALNTYGGPAGPLPRDSSSELGLIAVGLVIRALLLRGYS